MTQSYTEKDIRVLDEITHVRMNPEMYIGATNDPTHLVEESFDNALDEAMAGHSTIVAINVDTVNAICSVIDNGRGIPIDGNKAVIISTKLFSGSKFKDEKNAYQICSGLHGVGLVAVNVLSEWYTVEIYRDGKHAKYEFKNGKKKTTKVVEFKETPPFSTKIQFKADPKIFESVVPNVTRLRNRLLSASVELGSCTFVLNVDNDRQVIKLTPDEHFQKHCLQEADRDVSPVIQVEAIDKIEKFRAKLCYSFNGSPTPKVISSVNILPVEQGGSHVNLLNDILKDIFTSRAKKLGFKFQPADCLVGLRAYLSLEIVDAKFGGQTKGRLENKKSYFEKLGKKLYSELDAYFTANPDLTNALLDHFQKYRKVIENKKLKTGNEGKRGSTKFTKLRDCNLRGGELFIVEGDSAGGTFIDCRNTDKHAIFPLKGKIPSIANAKDILANKEIKELMQALGTGTGDNFDMSKLRYGKIICATDADSDGYHIFCLLTMALAILCPEIIKQGLFYLAMTPLYAINDSKTFTPLWTEEEVADAKSKGKPLQRYKGLGELNPDQLEIVTIIESTRKLIPIEYSEDMDDLMELFKSADEKRKLLDGDIPTFSG